MVMSPYPHGFTNGLSVRGLPLNVAHPGKVYFVNNSSRLAPDGIGGDDNGPGTYRAPFLTLDGAINKCVSGDIIMLMPGYAQTITNGTTIVPDVSGIAIIGLGEGALRPTISFSNTASNIILSGSNCFINNIVLLATVDSVVAGLTITGANNTVNIETRDTSAAVEFISPIVTTATADNLTIDWRHRGFAAGDAMTRGIDLVGCRDALINVDFFGCASVAVVNMRTTACDNIRITGKFYNESAALTKNVVNSTTSTWSVQGFDAKAANEFAGSDDVAVSYLSAPAIPQAVASAAKTLTTGDVNMFTITGGPIKVLELVGIVTTVVQAQATSVKVTVTTVSPAATVDFSAAAVDITGAAAGASIRHINTTGILTVVTAGFVNEGNAFATNDTQYLVPAGTMQLNNASASNTGAITWYLRYVPLAPGVIVT